MGMEEGLGRKNVEFMGFDKQRIKILIRNEIGPAYS